ncbi:Transcription factor [Penicillium chermesinum]|nr:Transcription factor [Penicillium chermesinum]
MAPDSRETSRRLPIFKSHDSDETRYFGRSCSLSIFSRTGIQWIKEKTGETAFLNIMSPNSTEDDPWNLWRPDVFHDLFASQVYKPLPSRAEVFSLIKDYFRTANRLFPLYHEASFMKMVEWQYTQQTCDDAARWASINMVICLAYEYRFSNNMKPEKDREKARLYFKNAISVFTELSLRRTDLLSVQAMLSMAFFLRGNSGSQYSLPFVTAAMRTCQRMGLHRDIPRPDLTPAQQEQRRRVFWVAFLVDQSSCLRAGSAPCQHPDDFNVPLPSELEGDDDPEVCSNLSFFRQLCRMCVIKSHIYCRLYSAKALRRDPKEIYQIVQELHADLIEWEKDYPLEEPPRLQQSETDFLFGFASLGLHFIYYNALIMIHRIPLLLNYYVPDRDDKPEIKALRAAQTAESARICVGAARSTLKLINNMPWGDMAWIRSLLYYVFLAAATLFSNIIRDTHNPGNREDIRAISMVSNFFSSLAPGDGTGNCAVFMTRVCNSLERIARMAVKRDEKGARSPDIKDKEHLSSAKKQASRSARSRDRRKPPPRQSSLPSYRDGAPHSHSSKDNSHTGMRSITLPSSHFTDNGIPENLADLPPINSSGYVVPLGLMENDNLSPSLAPPSPPPQLYPQSQPTTQPASGLSLEATAPQDFQSPPTMSPWEQLQHTNPATSASHSPFSQDSGNGQPNGPCSRNHGKSP